MRFLLYIFLLQFSLTFIGCIDALSGKKYFKYFVYVQDSSDSSIVNNAGQVLYLRDSIHPPNICYGGVDDDGSIRGPCPYEGENVDSAFLKLSADEYITNTFVVYHEKTMGDTVYLDPVGKE